MKDHITIEGQDGAFAAYIARPKTSPAPAVVVLQELLLSRLDELIARVSKKAH